jgi:hypothetical protein
MFSISLRKRGIENCNPAKSTRAILPIVVVLCSFLLACWYLFTPPIRMTQTGASVHFNLRKLDEYNSTLSRIQLTECSSSSVIWDAIPPSNAPYHQIGVFDLSFTIGDNTVSSGDYQNLVPSEGRSIKLRAGTCYRLRVYPAAIWKAHLFSASRTFSLQLPP